MTVIVQWTGAAVAINNATNRIWSIESTQSLHSNYKRKSCSYIQVVMCVYVLLLVLVGEFHGFEKTTTAETSDCMIVIEGMYSTQLLK